MTPAERKLSDNQIRVLKTLKRKPHTASETADLLSRRSDYITYNNTHGALRRLENRGYVRRTTAETKSGIKTVWELTTKGSSAVS